MTYRIAMISEHASPLAMLGGADSGGQNVYVAQLARHLAALGYRVDVFTRRDNAVLPEIVEWDRGVRVMHVTAGPAQPLRKEELLHYMPEFTHWLSDFCQRQNVRYDLIHANFFMSALVAADLKQTQGIPFVVTFHALGRVRRLHQGEADGFSDERFAIEDRIVAEADRIIAECPQDESDLVQLYQADRTKIEIIPCGFDPAEFAPVNKVLARVALGLPPHEPLILQLGRMVPRKGVDTVIRGFARLYHDYQVTARLLIVGGESDEPDPQITPEIGRLQVIAEEEGIAERVIFAGRRGRETLKYYYSAADVFVTLPWYEPFGITPLEAMACGTPVIGARVGGIKHTVVDNETGYLIDVKDHKALAARLAYLYQNPERQQQLSQQAVRHVNENFTWSKVAATVSTVYQAVLHAHQPQRQAVQLAIIDRGFEAGVSALQQAQPLLRETIFEAAQAISACFRQGGKVLVCGNGGSAADAQHFAAELVGRFQLPQREGLPALALTSDTAVLTAWSNDVGYEEVFARQVQALGRPGDLLLGISTSGQSRNVIRAFEAARQNKLSCIALVGGEGGALSQQADLRLRVPASNTGRIQEVHILILHLLCELIEEQLIADQALPLPLEEPFVWSMPASSPSLQPVPVLRPERSERTNNTLRKAP